MGMEEFHSRATECQTQNEVSDVIFSPLRISVHRIRACGVEWEVLLALRDGNGPQLIVGSVAREAGLYLCQNAQTVYGTRLEFLHGDVVYWWSVIAALESQHRRPCLRRERSDKQVEPVRIFQT